MPATPLCPRCHTPLPSDAPRGLCPSCLLKIYVRSDSEDPGKSEERTGNVSGTGAGPNEHENGARTPTWDELCATVSYDPSEQPPPRRGDGQRGAVTHSVVDLDQFLRSLIQSRLMRKEEVREFFERYSDEARPREAEHVARELIRARRLTEYQAGALLQGKSKGLAIGNYLILDKIGQGGMGMVFKARHRRTGRVVALKLLPPSYARDESAVLRFHREAKAAARLNHPNVVSVLDADEFNGLHFFVMEYVEGSDLYHLVRTEGPSPFGRAVDYVTQAARGLKSAHDSRIYHRDVTPSNLMLDRDGTIKVLDLGLARMDKESGLSSPTESDSGLTRPGAMMGTVDFMPPEQAYNSRDADHRSDIYSLGCTLYYLLVGKPPYAGETQMARVIAHREQPIPLLRDAQPEIPPILEATFRRMMAKAPEDRYQSMGELIADLEACRDTEREGSFRDPRVDTAPAPDTSPPGGTAVADRSTGPTRPSWRRVAAVGLVVSLVVLAAVVVDYRRGTPGEPVVKELPKARGAVEKREAGTLPPLVVNKEEPKKEPPPIEPVGEVRQFKGHERSRVEDIAVSSDGRRALSAGDDWTVRYWDISTGREIWHFAHDGPVTAVAFSPDDNRALAAGDDRTVRLWDLIDHGEIARFEGHTQPIYGVAYAPDGLRVLSGGGDKIVRLWDVATEREIRPFAHDGAVTAVAFSPDGRRVLSGSGDKTVRLWDVETGEEIRHLQALDKVWCVAFAPDGHRALSGSSDGVLTLWNLDNGTTIRRLEGPRDWVRCVAFLPDGHHALSGTQDGELILWDIERNSEVYRFEHTAQRLGVAVLPDGRHALTSEDDGSVHLWKLPEVISPVPAP